MKMPNEFFEKNFQKRSKVKKWTSPSVFISAETDNFEVLDQINPKRVFPI